MLSPFFVGMFCCVLCICTYGCMRLRCNFSWRSAPGNNRVGIHPVVPICFCGFDSVFRFCHRIFPLVHTSAGFGVSSGVLSSQSCFLLVHPVTVAVSVSFFVIFQPLAPFCIPVHFRLFCVRTVMQMYAIRHPSLHLEKSHMPKQLAVSQVCLNVKCL